MNEKDVDIQSTIVNGRKVSKRRISEAVEKTLKQDKNLNARKNSRKVSVHVNRQVVDHLKNRLVKRIENRISLVEGNRDGSSDVFQGKSNPKKNEDEFDLFSQYSDTGDVLHRKYLKAKRMSLCGGLTPINSAAKVVGPTSISEETVQSVKPKDHHTRASEPSMTKTIPDADYSNDQLGQRTANTNLNSNNDKSVRVEENKDDVSPVQTPYIWDKTSPDRDDESDSNIQSRIILGETRLKCPPETKRLRLYVISGQTDFEVERTYLQEHVFKKIKMFCISRGYDIDIYDLHYGFKRGLFDDHETEDLLLQSMNKCTGCQHAYTTLVLVGQKYGDISLPNTIPYDEFNQILPLASTRELATQELNKITVDDARKLDESSKSLGKSGDLNKSQTVSEGDREQSRNDDIAQRTSSSTEELNSETVITHDTDHVMMSDIINKWYGLDETVYPPVYRLKRISTFIPTINRTDPLVRNSARDEWLVEKKLLQQVLMSLAKELFHDQCSLQRYTSSVLDKEIANAFLNSVERLPQILVVKREFDNYEENLNVKAARDFFDILNDKPEINPELKDKLSKIYSDISGKVNHLNILNYQVPWKREGVLTKNCRSHATYLEKMAQSVFNRLSTHLLHEISSLNKNDENNQVYDEISKHLRHFQHLARELQGRKDTLTSIKTHLKSISTKPMVIYGGAGSGKSALLGKIILDAHKWKNNLAVVVRSVGLTSQSENVHQLLLSVTTQLCLIYNISTSLIPMEYTGLCNFFTQISSNSSNLYPLLIVIDSIDRLTDENDSLKLSWIPKELSPSTHIILSTHNCDNTGCLLTLKRLYPLSESFFLEIPNFTKDELNSVINYWLNCSSKKITEDRRKLLTKHLEMSFSPLLLKLTFNQVTNEASFVEDRKIKLGSNIKTVAVIKFASLENQLGEPFVRRCLGYISASRNGITSNEMLDLLSIDEIAMDFVDLNFSSLSRRFPNILWYKLKKELNDYLIRFRSGNLYTLKWAHPEIKTAADERYLQQRDGAQSYHKVLAEYFLNIWFNNPKPYGTNEKGVQRHVLSQELTYTNDLGSDADHTDDDVMMFNRRRLEELSFHLLNTQQMDVLKRETLCNFDYILGKIMVASVKCMLEEIYSALCIDPHDKELKLLSDTLLLSSNVLKHDPKQLGSQLIGRLHKIVSKDVGNPYADPVKYSFLQACLTQAQKSPFTIFIPSNVCLTEPSGVLFDLLSGHYDSITAVTVTSSGMQAVTASLDGTMKIWDLAIGRVSKSLLNVRIDAFSIKLVLNNTHAVLAYNDEIHVWNLRSSTRVRVIQKAEDPPIVTAADDGKFLIVVYDGLNEMQIWDLEHDFRLLHEKRLFNSNIHKINSIVICGNVYSDTILYALRGSQTTHAFKAKSGKSVCSLECPDRSSLITALAITRDYFVIACKQHYMKLHEIHKLELFDNRKGTHVRSIRGCTSDVVEKLHVNIAGSHIISVSSSDQSKFSEIVIWNLETGDHKHMCKHSGVSSICACVDFRYCLTAGKGDRTMRIWNLSKEINKPSPAEKLCPGIGLIVPVRDNPTYVVAQGSNNGPITIWNVVKAKCLRTAVRIERGLGDHNDIVLIRNMKVIILTDKGLSSVIQNDTTVFQTVLIYDLKTKKYDKKVKGCHILPLPPHEYFLMDNELLLGLSENRTNFIIWNLLTGNEVYRIRLNFREVEKKNLDIGITQKQKKVKVRGTTAKMSPWERRTETASAREKRHQQEKHDEKISLEILQKERDNAIENYIVSGNENIIVASYYAHHLCVFNIKERIHIQTIDSDTSMLFLYTSAINFDGSYLALTNYDEDNKASYVTLWDCKSGQIKRRLKNESNVCVIAITDNAEKIIFAKTSKELRIWEPLKQNSVKRIKGLNEQNFSDASKMVLFDNDERLIVLAGCITVYDLNRCCVLASFTPDFQIQSFATSLNGNIISFGLSDNPNVITLKLASRFITPICDSHGEELFGETTGDTSDDDEDANEN